MERFNRYADQCATCCCYYLNVVEEEQTESECTLGERCSKKEPCVFYRKREV
jgi:hypothetical protein